MITTRPKASRRFFVRPGGVRSISRAMAKVKTVTATSRPRKSTRHQA
jgi:hypothetical protein